MDDKSTVLVVEDDPLIREIVGVYLEDAGYRVVSACDVSSACDALDDQPDIAAAFVDIDLGDHGGGYQVARHAKAVKANLAVIYTSGGAQASFAEERVDGALFVQKPYAPSRVCALIGEQLERLVA